MDAFHEDTAADFQIFFGIGRQAFGKDLAAFIDLLQTQGAAVLSIPTSRGSSGTTTARHSPFQFGDEPKQRVDNVRSSGDGFLGIVDVME